MAARTTMSIPAARPLTIQLSNALANWSTSQRTVVGLAADFADAGEWAAAGVASAAHWIGEVADIEVSTAREWIRIGRLLRSLTLIADAFLADELSYSKVRTLTPIAAPANQAELLEIATSVPAGHLGRALASWMHRTSSADALEQLVGAGAGRLTTEIVVHVRGDGATFDDGTPLPISVVERIAPQAFIRALIHAADGRPVNASPKRRHPSTRQKRVVKERDQACVDCGASTLLVYDHVPDYAQPWHGRGGAAATLRPLPPPPPRTRICGIAALFLGASADASRTPSSLAEVRFG